MRPNKEIPMLFSTPMVQAILEGRKTQTRRLVFKKNNMPKSYVVTVDGIVRTSDKEYDEHDWKVSQPYKVGDTIWVRETFAKILCEDKEGNTNYCYTYKADEHPFDRTQKWNPSIHMPKKACRLFLKITGLRVEPLNNISEAEAIAEGIEPLKGLDRFRHYLSDYRIGKMVDAKESFKSLWNSIHKKENTWQDNPLVFVIKFEVIKK